MTLLRISRGLLLTAALTLGGCSLVPSGPVLYQLDGGELPASTSKTSRLTVQLEAIGVAEYLRSEQLVQRQLDDSLLISTRARWAGPLSSNFAEQLLRQLSAQLNTDKLIQAPVPEGFRADLLVRLDVTRFDAGPAQPAVLEAHWRLLDAAGTLRGSQLLRLSEPHQGLLADQVRAQNVLLQRLAEQLAAAVNAQPPLPPKPQAATKPAVSPPPAVKTPRVPLSIPMRNNVEVFRF